MLDRRVPSPLVAPVRLWNLLWVPIVASAWIAGWVFGTPHLRVKYTYIGPWSRPYYLACHYWGLTSFRIDRAGAHCPLFVLARGGDAR